jgi:uncharacterized protein (UPF0210 family)
MKIRSITYFDSLQWPLDGHQIQNAGDFIKSARDTFEDQNFDVQTTRLASIPFPLILQEETALESVNFAVGLEAHALGSGFDYASIGPAIPSNMESYQVIPEVLRNTQSIFAAGIISSAEIGIVPGAIKECAGVIIKNSRISPDGFGNLRFAALANVPAGSPFLPAAYHGVGRKPGFAIATEAADLAVSAFATGTNLDNARKELVASIEKIAHELTSIGEKLAMKYDVRFEGIDFSLAPFPTPEQSIGTAVEKLGVPGVGNHGSLAAITLLAEALDRAKFPKVGFNGVMLPVLEDTVLAGNAAANLLTVNDLLLYSAVCGTALDTIPLPGSISEDQLYGVLLDLAALAERLKKSLTARLMPIPGKKAGDATEFDFEFFANSKIMGLNAGPLTGRLTENGQFQILSKGK